MTFDSHEYACEFCEHCLALMFNYQRSLFSCILSQSRWLEQVMPHLSPASTLCCVLADTLASLQPSVASCLGKSAVFQKLHFINIYDFIY